ncbi:DNA cytosine methyltransferase [Phocaeicola coprocola]|jgi:DNA (cytosine-5)-methyltransferase 1|uniref:DNA cytosine methyltransferase n=1 Tax=Phocaeicola coprocola TaxID=310298 RepID=UPI00397A97EB
MGWRNVFHCEINEFGSAILKYWFPDSEHYGDITKTDFTRWRGKIDVLSGGFPCQPFSVAGRRKGTSDDRYLWPEMLRAIQEIRPAWIVGENVAGITSMVQSGQEVTVAGYRSLFGETDTQTLLRQEFVLETVCGDLERAGYSVQPFVIPACAVGAPHRRDRIWFIAKENSPSASDTCCQRCECRGNHWNKRQVRDDFKRDIPENQQKREKRKCWTGENEQAAADPKGEQSKRHRSEQSTDSAKKQREPGRSGSENDSRYTMRSWENFPTQSPVCRGDDGFPFNVDELSVSFPKWRTESIKAYGNAVVPPLVYRIFQGIENADNADTY